MCVCVCVRVRARVCLYSRYMLIKIMMYFKFARSIVAFRHVD